MIDVMLAGWFAATVISVVYVAWDAATRNPELTVMKWGWVLVTLYTGPVGAALYVLACREPAPFTHERFIAPLWKQGVGSTVHCLAGDVTGIVVAASITAALGSPLWLDALTEYVFGFAFGLLIFQALFMRSMLGGSYVAALRATIVPEWLSMNGVMTGMIPVMVILMSRQHEAMGAGSPRFWGVVSLATLTGGIIAYPINVWLVNAKLKHGMGTVRALGKGGHPVATERAPQLAGAVAGAAAGSSERRLPLAPADEGHMAMERRVPTAQIAAIAVLTLVALVGGILLAGVAGDFTM